MRTPKHIKQVMYYSLLIGKEPIYEVDDQGRIVYQIIAGEQIPIETGEDREIYSIPVVFFNSISGQLTEDELQAFGTEATASAKITYKREAYPFRAGTLIWKQSKVKFNADGSVDETSADYRVSGVMREGQSFWKAILQVISHETGDRS